MNVAQSLQSWINRPAPATLACALAASAIVLLVGCLVMLLFRRRWVGLFFGVVGMLASEAVLLVVNNQTVTYRESPSVRVTRPRHSEKIRSLARGGMVGVPGAVALAGAAAWASARRRRRASLPGVLKAGRAHLLQNEFEPALAQFSHAIRIAPYLAEAYVGRGTAYVGMGDMERAQADFDQAIESDPRLAPAYIHRARLRMERGELDGALDDLSRVMDIHPTDPELYLTRGICLLKKGKPGEAAIDFHRVLKLTNHSDFAEPAKDYLRQLEGHHLAASQPPLLPAPEANGVPDSTARLEHEGKDHIV